MVLLLSCGLHDTRLKHTRSLRATWCEVSPAMNIQFPDVYTSLARAGFLQDSTFYIITRTGANVFEMDVRRQGISLHVRSPASSYMQKRKLAQG
jgi:hypothetical protein